MMYVIDQTQLWGIRIMEDLILSILAGLIVVGSLATVMWPESTPPAQES